MDRRAAGLPALYNRKLAGYDRRFHGAVGNEAGPLVRRLQSFGDLQCLVVGPWGNGSKHLHELVHTLAECRIATRNRARGWEGGDKELGLVTGQIRRSLSVDFVRAQALCLFSRLAHLGDGAQAAALRRQQAGQEEEGRRREEIAHYIAHIRGRGVNRAGEVFVQQ